jgi:hypothetical protein
MLPAGGNPGGCSVIAPAKGLGAGAWVKAGMGSCGELWQTQYDANPRVIHATSFIPELNRNSMNELTLSSSVSPSK